MIAIISAFGVIVTSIVQWRSNVVTNKSSLLHSQREAQAREQQLLRESREREAIRLEERNERLALRQEAKTEIWREKRKELHDEALSKLDPLISAAATASITMYSLVLLETVELGKKSVYTQALHEFETAYATEREAIQSYQSSIGLYGSASSADAFRVLALELSDLAYEALKLTSTLMHDSSSFFTEKHQVSIENQYARVSKAYKAYIDSAREDLQTN